MKIITTVTEMQHIADGIRQEGKTIAVVPTMGYLHEGHLSLIRIGKGKCDVVVATIFVNPLQFGPAEDFARYPRDVERDRELLASSGTDVVFVPRTEEMYSEDHFTYVNVEKIADVLEGKFRPNHFRGVATVVAKLFNIVKPHVAVFGQKDAQQAVIIKRMVSDLNFDIEMVVAPIVREADGLAMSSRNVFLSPHDRHKCSILNESLRLAEQLIAVGSRDSASIISSMKEKIGDGQDTKIDYISIADADTLEELVTLSSGAEILVSLAVRIGTTRLIDNIVARIE